MMSLVIYNEASVIISLQATGKVSAGGTLSRKAASDPPDE